MSTLKLSRSDLIGCSLYIFFTLFVGPALCVWACFHVFDVAWWINVLLGISVGGIAGYLTVLVFFLCFGRFLRPKANRRKR